MLAAFNLLRALVVLATVAGFCLQGAARAEEAAGAELPVPLAARYASQHSAEQDAAQFVKLFSEWKSIDRIVSPPAPSAAPPAGSVTLYKSLGRQMRAPVGSVAVTSGFGERRHPILGSIRAHRGIDLAARMGAPIYATADGVVSAAGWRGGYGLAVALDHGGGIETRYAHMSRLNVADGQRVRKGDVIGFVGSTGMSTGPHLHYETRVNGQAVNPVPYIRGK